jgi:hypothetical protein
MYHYNDTWSFDIATGSWTELSCIGYIPVPREGHAAAIVDDVVYIFGGRDVNGKDLGDLAAFRITSKSHDVLLYRLADNARSTMVYVPEHGSRSDAQVRTCDGRCSRQDFRDWRRSECIVCSISG